MLRQGKTAQRLYRKGGFGWPAERQVGLPAAAPRIDEVGKLTLAVLRLIKSPTITNPVEIPDPRLEFDRFDIESSDSIELNYRRLLWVQAV